MTENSLKEQADKLMKIKGGTKGSEILTLSRYVEVKYGKEGVEALEKKMEELGYPCRFNEIRPGQWYREALNVLAMLAAKNLFNWTDLFDLGYNSPVFSFGVKVFIKFIPLTSFIKQIPEIWKKFLDFGTLEVHQLNEKEKYLALHLKNCQFHPELCRYYAGFFLRIAEYLIRSKELTIEETRCTYKNDPYHEYIIRWK